MRLPTSTLVFICSLAHTACASANKYHARRNTHMAHIARDVSNSGNWGGAEVSGIGVSALSSALNVPRVSAPDTPPDQTAYAGSAWIGIDGGPNQADDCHAILQAGIVWETSSTDMGKASYSAFYEWFPDPPVFVDLPMVADDTVEIVVSAMSPTTGSVAFYNQNTGLERWFSVSGSEPLCQMQAEWIIEDQSDSSSGGLVPFASFTPVVFQDCYMEDLGGAHNLSEAGLERMVQGGRVFVDCDVLDQTTMECDYGL